VLLASRPGVRRNRCFDRRVEVALLEDRCLFVALDLAPDRVLQLGEDERDAALVEVAHQP